MMFNRCIRMVKLPVFRCWRICILSSSELCDEDDGSTSETPESAGLGGREPVNRKYHNIIGEVYEYIYTYILLHSDTAISNSYH